MSELPEPLTPPDCDLTSFEFMPLDVARLRDAGIVDAITGEEFRAAVLLWCASWHQVPAGSLPDDDAQLARLAGYGRVVKEWLKVKSGALYGFIKCADGRLYHPTVCEKALEAHASRKKASKRGHAGASKRWGIKDAQSTKDDRASINPATENHSKGQDRTGQDNSAPNGAGETPPPQMPKHDPWKAVYDRGKQVLGRESGGQITKLRKLYDDKLSKVSAKIEDAAEHREPAKWLAAFLWKVDDGGKLSGEYIGGVPP